MKFVIHPLAHRGTNRCSTGRCEEGTAMDVTRDGTAEGTAEGTARKRPPVGVAARAYVRRGWRVVELRPRSKAPAQPGWQEMHIGESALLGTFLPDRNIGLLTGEAGGGLVDVDCDTIEAQIASTTTWPPPARVAVS